jgi:hypothetical protein
MKRADAERAADLIVDEPDASLLDIVDHVLNQGIVLTGDVMLSVANVDLIYLRISALLCAADRIFPPPERP